MDVDAATGRSCGVALATRGSGGPGGRPRPGPAARPGRGTRYAVAVGIGGVSGNNRGSVSDGAGLIGGGAGAGGDSRASRATTLPECFDTFKSPTERAALHRIRPVGWDHLGPGQAGYGPEPGRSGRTESF